jgi:hypothetical protein
MIGFFFFFWFLNFFFQLQHSMFKLMIKLFKIIQKIKILTKKLSTCKIKINYMRNLKFAIKNSCSPSIFFSLLLYDNIVQSGFESRWACCPFRFLQN